VLAVMVDEVAKRRLLREFAIDVSSNIIGRQLPEAMREDLRAYLSLGVIRSNWTVTYTIEEIDGKPGYVKLHTRSEWEVENRLAKEQAYGVTYSVEKSWFPEVGETQLTRLGVASPYPSESFDYHSGDRRISAKLEGGMWVAAPKCIHLPAHPHAVFRCWAESVEYYRSDFSTPFVAAIPVQRLSVVVRYPEGQFKVGLLLSFEDSEMSNPAVLPGEHKWEISKTMLPGQCFFTTWQRITPRPAAGTTFE
jgi:hypothetical protein